MIGRTDGRQVERREGEREGRKSREDPHTCEMKRIKGLLTSRGVKDVGGRMSD